MTDVYMTPMGAAIAYAHALPSITARAEAIRGAALLVNRELPGVQLTREIGSLLLVARFEGATLNDVVVCGDSNPSLADLPLSSMLTSAADIKADSPDRATKLALSEKQRGGASTYDLLEVTVDATTYPLEPGATLTGALVLSCLWASERPIIDPADSHSRLRHWASAGAGRHTRTVDFHEAERVAALAARKYPEALRIGSDESRHNPHAGYHPLALTN